MKERYWQSIMGPRDRAKEVTEMRTILKSFLVCSLLLSGVTSLEGVNEQEWGGKEKIRIMEQRGEKFHHRRLQKLSEELGLSKEQEEKISQIMKKGWEKIREEMRKMKERVLAIRKDTDSQIEKLLTSEQLEKFKELKQEFKERRKERMEEGREGCGE